VRAEFVAFWRRTEEKLAGWAAGVVAISLLFGMFAFLEVRDRHGWLDDAVERRVALTAAALDVYRVFADADASSLDAVLVEPELAVVLRQRHRETVFDATDALREAASLDSGNSSANRLQQLIDLIPEYVRLVEAGWTNLGAGHSIGTSYLAQASSLVRDQILPKAEELYTEQTQMLTDAQFAAGRPTWLTFTAGALAVVTLVAAQRFVRRRTHRRVNPGLAAATLLTLVAMVWLTTALVLTAGHATDSEGIRGEGDRGTPKGVVALLKEARNLGREADGDEARLLIFPSQGASASLKDKLTDIERKIAAARPLAKQGGRPQIDAATGALRSWREALPPEENARTYRKVAESIIDDPTDDDDPPATQLDKHLSEAIDLYARRANADILSAWKTLDDLDVILAGLAVLAGGAAMAGLWPRIAEYYR
jgi:hypothetical protein